MVCAKATVSDEAARLKRAEMLAPFYGLSVERARFLASCAHSGTTHNNTGSFNKAEFIPYSDEPLIREAARLGISLHDTAEMMNMPAEKVAAYGFAFVPVSTAPKPLRGSFYNLLAAGDDNE